MPLTRTIHKRDGTHFLGDATGRARGTRLPGRRCSGMWTSTSIGGKNYAYTIEAVPGGGWGTREVEVRDLATDKVRVVRWKRAVREDEILARLQRLRVPKV